MNARAWAAALALAFVSSAASAQSVGFGIGGGLASADTSNGKGKDGSAFQLSGSYSAGFQDRDVGFNWFTGVLWQQTDGAEVAGYGKTSIKEGQIPIGFGFRFSRVSLFMFADYRNIKIKTGTGIDSSDGDIWALGGGIRVPFGAAGTMPGRFAVRASYAEGEGSFKDPGTLNVKEDVKVKDTRLALEYTPSGHWLGRLEYRKAEYDGNGSSPLFDQTFDSTMLIVGYSF